MARGASLRSLAKEERPASTAAVARRIAGYLAPYRLQAAGGIAWLVVASAMQAAGPALSGRLIDAAVAARAGSGSTGALTIPATLLVATTFGGWLAQRMQILVLGTAGQHALHDLRRVVFDTVQRLPVGFFDAVESGDLMSRLVNDIEQVNSFLSQGLRRLIASALGLAAMLAAMLWVNWVLALATLLVVPVMLVISRLFGTVARRAFRRRQEAIGDVSATLAEELAGIRVAQAFDRIEYNRDAFERRNAANRDANVNAAVVSSAFSPVLSVVSTGATALIAALGGALAARSLISIGVVVAFFGYARAFFNAVSQLSSLYAETQAALAGAERVFGLIDTPIDVADAPGAIELGRVNGEIAYHHVSFGYGDGPDVLHDVDLTIAAGTKVAIVGSTGAGKTTLMNLAARFYDPRTGSVTVDGHDLRAVTMRSLRANLGVVLQEPFLFAGSIADNIRYGRLDATDDEVRQAADAAGATGLIDRLPDGLATDVGERGTMLSTGERQLVAIARAILADPAIMMLDEATSSVDTRTERMIQDGLRRLLEGRTALIIAHRLSTVRDADRIVVIEGGRIVEDGDYATLHAAGGAFARLHEAQFAG